MALKQIKTLLKNVTTAGTRVQLSTTKLIVRNVRIVARSGNAGVVYLGDVTVAAANGFQLAAGVGVNLIDLFAPGEDLSFDLNKFYLDAANNGDGVTIMYFDNAAV